MTTPPSKSTSRVPKHPAARALEGKVEEEDGHAAQSQVDKMLSVTPGKDAKVWDATPILMGVGFIQIFNSKVAGHMV